MFVFLGFLLLSEQLSYKSVFAHLLPGPGSFRESPRPSGQDPNLWTVDEVMQYIRDIDPVLAPHADLFRKHVRIHSFMNKCIMNSECFKRVSFIHHF